MGLITPKYDNTLPIALSELAEYAGVQISAVVPGEVGAGNSTIPMITAAAMGIQTIDSDYAGDRSIPELSQITPEILGKSIFPIVMVDRWGDISIIKAGAGAQMADRIGRMLAAAAYGGVAFACLLMQVKDARALMNLGSMTQALEIGRILRQAREQGTDPANAVVKQHDGWVLFRGEVERTEVEDKEAYMFGYGTHYLRGVGDFAGHIFRIWYKNEYHVSWLDDRPYVSSPDIIALVDSATGEAYPNGVMAEGLHMAVIGTPVSDVAYRSDEGIAILEPRHFGFDIPYVKIEDAMRGH